MIDILTWAHMETLSSVNKSSKENNKYQQAQIYKSGRSQISVSAVTLLKQLDTVEPHYK